MARNTKTSKKAAATQSSPKKAAPAPNTSSSADGTQVPPARPVATTQRTDTFGPSSWRFKLFLLIIPLMQMLWNAEAPRRPFSAVREPTTGLPIPELVEPKILLVTAEPGDLVIFTPTVSAMLEEPRKSTAEFYAVSFSGGKEGGREGWEQAWNLFGLEEGKREILDVPGLEVTGKWDPNVISNSVQAYVLQHKIDTILTYDNTSGILHHDAVLKGLSSLFSSPAFKQTTLRTPEGVAYAPRIMMLRSSPPERNFSVLTPIVEHILLAIRAIRFDAVKAKAEGLRVPTFFVSDIRKYVKSWRALLGFQSQRGPVELLFWVVSRSLWVNEWVEL